MIIRTSFSDNDFTHLLQEYWSGFWFKNYYCMLDELKDSDEYEDLKKYKDTRIEAEELLEKAFYHEDDMSLGEFKRFGELITESILAYIKSKREDSMDYLSKMFSIRFIPSVKDKCENGEVVYYFLGSKRFVTM